MKKWDCICERICKILMRLAALVICGCGVLWLFGQHLYLPPFSSGELCYLSVCVIAVSGLLWLGVDWLRASEKWYHNLFKGIALFLIVLLVEGILFVFSAFSGFVGDFQRCDSPDGQHSIVIENESQFAVEWATVYMMTSPITMKEVGTYGDILAPKYWNIIWHDNYVELIQGGETLRFDYAQK